MKNTQCYLEIIRAVIPAEPIIVEYQQSGDYGFNVSWKLNSDPNRLSKKSKEIHILITSDVVDEFEDHPKKWQESVLDKLEELLNERLEGFDPEHDAPVTSPPPVEEWIITLDMLMD